MELPTALFGLNPQNFFLKNFLYFFLKKSALKKFLIFFLEKAFLIFPEMEPCTFRPQPQNFFPKRISYNFS